MAKNQTIILLAGLLVCLWSCDLPRPDLSGQAELVPTTARDRIVHRAIHEIGVREEGGNNRGERIGEYVAATGLGQGHPWCAAFTKWVYEQEAIDTPGANAWSPSWFPTSQTIWSRGGDLTPVRKADVFGIYYPNLKRIGHVGIIEKQENGWIYTIEGNTGDDQGREGDVVRRHKRSMKQVHKVANWID
ncbi:MAG TPA: peptidoglycan-binding protein [Algoriphagus sp.]|nr:peptidoglycan-binding protein [Algoriphagus sp.]